MLSLGGCYKLSRLSGEDERMINWQKCTENEISHAVYRGFIVHKWDSFYCLYYIEAPNTKLQRQIRDLEDITGCSIASRDPSHAACDIDPSTGIDRYIYCLECLPEKLDDTIDYLLNYRQDLTEEHMERLERVK